MLVIPAIDLSEGKVVRLRQGRMDDRTVYGDDPAAVATQFAEAGAQVIHVIDLDGATTGEPRHLEALSRIAAACPGTGIQFGGGLRTMDAIQAALDAGARWVILGTVAVRSPDLLAAALERFGDAIIVAIDARDGMVAIEGWQEATQISAVELAKRMERAGVQRLLCTDIASDGVLRGPNLAGLERIARAVSVAIIASGGVSSLEDIRALRRLEPLGIIGCVVGRALYDGRLNLREAIRAAGC